MNFALPKGFRFASAACGVKTESGAEDIALVACDSPMTAAGVYTTNIVCAAPVEWDRRLTPMSDCCAVLVNSGNANACTGRQGEQDAAAMAGFAAEQLGCRPDQVLVLSTGVIGRLLPMDKIAAGVTTASQHLGSDSADFLGAARGILTTDQDVKIGGRVVVLGGVERRVVGMAKGAGMIGPNMATLLGVLMTDAPLTPQQADAVLRRAAQSSFNRISVEGHMSTNDTVLLLAPAPDQSGELNDEEIEALQTAVEDVCIELAKQIPADGEGATHLIQIDVLGAASDADADRIGRTVAASALVKTAVAGADPNWGRIVSAAGYSGAAFEPGRVDLQLNGVRIYEQGAPVAYDAASLSTAIRNSFETYIQLRVGDGPGKARLWTSDLTVEYVRFNSDYTT